MAQPSLSFLSRTLISLFWLLLSAVCSVQAAADVDAIVLDDSSRQIAPGPYLRLVEDATGSWTLQQARAELENGERWLGPGFPSFGITDSIYWLAVTLDSRLVESQPWFAVIDYPSLDRVELYYQDAGGQWLHKVAGDTLPYNEREVRHHSIAFTFPLLPAQTQTLYFRVESKGSLQVPLSLFSETEFHRQSLIELFWAGCYYGILFVVALYSFFVWFSTSDRSHLYFVLFLLSIGFYSFSSHGFAYQYLWPDASYWANRSIIVLIGLTVAAAFMFVRTFLEFDKVNQRIDKWLKVAAGCALAYAVIALVAPYLVMVYTVSGFLLATMALLSLATWSGLKGRVAAANFFAGAWGVMLATILLEALQRLGMSLPPLLSYHSIQLGAFLSIALLSVGLGDRVNKVVKQYSEVQQDMLQANQLKIEALQKADDVKEEFIANVSHELRTPLTGIIGLSEIILESRGDRLDEASRENLMMIKISGQRLANLVNDVIDFSAVKHGHLELNKKAVDLKRICILVNKMCRPLIGDKPIQLAERLPEEPVWVLGDEDRLQQILFNLVSNAIKFTQRGWVAVSIEIIDIDARVMVKDTGIGISRAQQARIFNRFYQIDSAATREEGGTGLGLAISQKLVELHGTEIILRSSQGEGSTFYFDLPLLTEKEKGKVTKEQAQKKLARGTEGRREEVPLNMAPMVDRRKRVRDEPVSKAMAQSIAGRRAQILVVDDEYLNVRIVKEHLSESYDITSAQSGHDALTMIGQNKPDLIILDLMMPIMTGFEVCQRVREKYTMDELPIVMLTAKNRVEDLVKGLNMGANDYISKPFSKEELLVRIGKQFEMLHLLEVRKENQQLHWQLQRHQEAADKLRERESRFARMLDITGDALVSVDENGTVVYVNRTAEELLGVDAEQFQNAPLNTLMEQLDQRLPELSATAGFPFKESVISPADKPIYFIFALTQPENSSHEEQSGDTVDAERIRVCILPLNLDQEFHLLMFQPLYEHDDSIENGEPESLPQLINEINRNAERTQILSGYLSRITPEDLQKHRHLFQDLENVDRAIQSISDVLSDPEDTEQQYREALVKLMQDCHYYWQKITGESIIELAEKSRIWSVSIDNGRLRTRSMNRYLSIDKLPSNPRWRQVARTAYFVLSKVAHDSEAKSALETSVSRLQDIVEAKALT